MKKLFTYIILFGTCFSMMQTYAQNDLELSNYMFDNISYNPSFTGTGETFRATLLARKQWLGFEGSPLSQTLSVDGKTKHFGGLGLHVVNDKLGFENVVTATFNYSYGVHLGATTELTAGFAAGIIDRYIDVSEFVYQNQVQSDPEGYLDNYNKILPTLNIGLNLIHKNLTVGVSSTHIASSLSQASVAKIPRHIFGFAQYKIKPENAIYAVPSVLVKYGSSETQIEGNVNVYFNNRFWLGTSYRINESIIGLAGLIFKDRIYIGYSYDYNIGEHRYYTYGSHEIFLSWRMKKDPRQKGFYQSTRLFN